MTPIRVRKRVGLRGRDERQLNDRLNTLGHAIHARCGRIIDITWHGRTVKGGRAASVIYQVPLESRARPFA